MGWNGSDGKKKTTLQSTKSKKHSIVIWTVVLLTVIFGFIFFTSKPEENNVTVLEKKSKVVKEHAKSPQKKNSKVSPKLVTEKREEALKEISTNRVAKHSGKFIDISKAIIIPHKEKPKVFKHSAEESIASLLEATPGNVVIGNIDYHKKGKFEKSLRESMTDPTVISDNDSEYVKDLKLAVSDVKKELLTRMKAGENPADIMTQSRAELQKLGFYRMELEKELKQIRKDPNIDKDSYNLFVEAANQMLKNKGGEPLFAPKVVYRQLMLKEKRSQQ